MNCWTDQTLHWAVRRLLDTDADAQAVLSGEEYLPEDCPTLLSDTIDHVRICPSCALTARELLDTELELLAMEEVEQIIALVVTPAWSPQVQASPEEDHDPVEYAVAADSPGGGERISLDGHSAISLASKDGRYLVRIFRNEEGEGATAVLLRTQEPDDGEDNEADSGISLSLDGKDYRFDAEGTVKLPAFPATPPSLVLRVR